MIDVFLSYTREDAEQAARFAEMLEAAGLSVWWDRQIPPGKTWDQVIGQALDEARCVVVLWTGTSVQSDWVKEEAARGARRGALVPVLLDAIEAPLGFGRIEAAELAEWDGDPADGEFQNFVAAVQELVDKPIDVRPERRRTKPSGLSRRVFAWGGAVAVLLVVAGILGWSLSARDAGGAWVLDAEIREVEHDREGAVKTAKTFSVNDFRAGADGALEDLASRVVAWATAEIVPPGGEPVEVQLVIPQDPTSERIRILSRPEVELKTYLYVTSVRGKSRVLSQLRPEDLAFAGEEFAIEIAATGYDSLPVPVIVGEAQDRKFEMRPLRVKLAVEEIAGLENRLAARLTALLASHERIEVFGPEALNELRRELERSQDAIGVNRAAQVAIRDSLGVDYILAGELTEGGQ